jgi:hypothetical protein
VTGEESDSATPASLTWAVRLLLLQAAGLAALTVYLVIRLITADEVLVGPAVGLILMAAVGAAAVVVVARSLGRLRPGARGPAILVQLLLIASGGFLLQTGPGWLGLILMATGVLTGVLIVLPASTRALGVD